MPSIRSESVVDVVPMTKEINVTDHPKIAIMGATGVGKTSIVQQFLYDSFPVDHVKTIEEMHKAIYDVSGSTLHLDILDTSGFYEFPAMRRLAIKSADAIVLVYAINDSESFRYVSHLKELIEEVRPSGDLPTVVVGNKCDLESSRQVPRNITESVVTIDWEDGFVETSAKENTNILQVFKTVLRQAHIRYALAKAVERRRKSLPATPTYKVKHAMEQKRHSCVVQ